MTTVIFVHGTGVRKSQYFETFEQIKKNLHAQHPGVKVVPCCWGEELGTKLNAQGTSIPLYDTTLALGEEEGENEEILLWEQLYCNPFYELSLLSLQPVEESGANPFAEQPGDLLHSRLQSLSPNADLEAKLVEAEIVEVFDEARQVVTRSEPYNQVLLKVSEESLGEYCDAVARAIVAQAMLLCELQEKYPPILIDAKLRDEIVKLLSQALGKEGELGLGGWLWKPLSLLAHPSTSLLKYKRGAITAAFSPLPCDILLYQARGKPIRTFIKETIKQAEPPVVLLAHSLGGIAGFDLLVQEPLSEVELMVTVGSQVPFLYEINALQSLPYGEPLPEHFPDWLNIYDLRDFLSYIGANVFPNKVQDVLVDNKQPFPRAHSAYWTNPSTWKAIIPRLP
jgi:hypothetical protein